MLDSNLGFYPAGFLDFISLDSLLDFMTLVRFSVARIYSLGFMDL
ncbi:hypothetical protein [Helicobacter sp. MIT 01-3238]|nr:hypothetical protein [Helicobacter sp. MIT 01-3238]